MKDEVLGGAGLELTCLGDIMLFSSSWCQGNRHGQLGEPIYLQDRTAISLGGAGNVLRILDSLHVKVKFVGHVSDDEEGREIEKLCRGLRASSIHLLPKNSQSTSKVRYYFGEKLLFRIDREIPEPPSYEQEQWLQGYLNECAAKSRALILSDYNKGFLSQEIIRAAKMEFRKNDKPVFIDSKSRNWEVFEKADFVKVSEQELKSLFHRNGPELTEDEALRLSRQALERTGAQCWITTLGHRGCVLVTSDHKAIPIAGRSVVSYDECGAGDCFLACFAYKFLETGNIDAAARWANYYSGEWVTSCYHEFERFDHESII